MSRGGKQSYVVASSAVGRRAPATMSYGVPGERRSRHVVFDAPEDASGKSTVSATAQNGRCVVTITAGAGFTGHPLIFDVADAAGGCAVTEGVDAPPAPVPGGGGTGGSASSTSSTGSGAGRAARRGPAGAGTGAGTGAGAEGPGAARGAGATGGARARRVGVEAAGGWGWGWWRGRWRWAGGGGGVGGFRSARWPPRPVLEALGLAEVEHGPKNNRMRAR